MMTKQPIQGCDKREPFGGGRILLLAIFFQIAFNGFTQSVKHADKLFNRWDYYKASKCYEKIAKKHPSQDIYYKLGECYRKMDRYNEAMIAYDKVKKMGAYPVAEFYLHDGLVLKNNNQCEQAKTSFATYTSMKAGDTMGAFYSKSCDIIREDHQWDEPIAMNNLPSLNTAYADFGPVLYKNGLVFTSSRKTENHDYLVYGWTGEYYLDLFYAPRDSNSLTFKKPVQLEENMIDLAYHDGPATFSANFDTIYISRSWHDLRGQKKKTLNINRVKIYSAPMGEYKWEGMQSFAYNNDTFSVAHPFITRDGKHIYFSSDMPGGYGDADIYVCARENGTWSVPQNLGPGVNTFGKEAFPSIDSLGNLYFSSDGYQGFGGLDICVALNNIEPSGSAMPFKQAKVLKSPFNSSTNDFGIVFMKDGRNGYFSSNRFGGVGDDDIYYFNLDQDPVKKNLRVQDYTIGYRPYADYAATAKVRIHFVDARNENPIDSGRFWRVDAGTQKYHDTIFSGGFTEFTVPEKTTIQMHTLCRFYDLYDRSLTVPDMNADTVINLTFSLTRTPVKERLIVVRTPDNKVKGKSELAFFDFAKFNIRPDATKHLDSVVMHMEEYPDALVDISAHTDSRGSEKYNMNLSEQRAQSAMRYLNSKGISMTRMRAKGYGYSRLLNHCSKGVKCTEEEHQLNRRVEFWIKAAF